MNVDEKKNFFKNTDVSYVHEKLEMSRTQEDRRESQDGDIYFKSLVQYRESYLLYPNQTFKESNYIKIQLVLRTSSRRFYHLGLLQVIYCLKFYLPWTRNDQPNRIPHRTGRLGNTKKGHYMERKTSHVSVYYTTSVLTIPVLQNQDEHT